MILVINNKQEEVLKRLVKDEIKETKDYLNNLRGDEKKAWEEHIKILKSIRQLQNDN